MIGIVRKQILFLSLITVVSSALGMINGSVVSAPVCPVGNASYGSKSSNSDNGSDGRQNEQSSLNSVAISVSSESASRDQGIADQVQSPSASLGAPLLADNNAQRLRGCSRLFSCYCVDDTQEEWQQRVCCLLSTTALIVTAATAVWYAVLQ